MTGVNGDNSAAIPCPDGLHDFEQWPSLASGEIGILIGHSRCRRCGTIADEFKIEPGDAGSSPSAAEDATSEVRQ
jgi:hypothetical protein